METETTVESVEQVVEAIRKREIVLSTTVKIVADGGRLTPEEREYMTANRAAVVSYLNSQSAAPVPEQSESPEAAYQRGDAAGYARGQAEGYALGVRDTTMQLQAKTQTVVDKPAQVPKTPEQQIAEFVEWQAGRGVYYQWETTCMQELRDTLQSGDRIVPRFAYSCYIVHSDGTETEFHRRPKK